MCLTMSSLNLQFQWQEPLTVKFIEIYFNVVYKTFKTDICTKYNCKLLYTRKDGFLTHFPLVCTTGLWARESVLRADALMTHHLNFLSTIQYKTSNLHWKPLLLYSISDQTLQNLLYGRVVQSVWGPCLRQIMHLVFYFTFGFLK